jgi:rare lipoprotein A
MTAAKRLSNFLTLCAAFVLLAACSETQLVSHWAKKITWPGQTESAGTYKVGKPYRVGSVWYYPQEDFKLVETGIASWYGPDFHGKRTANGERYDQYELTAAHRTLQMPSLVRVVNLENGRSVVVRINDRGPFKHGRVIDLSRRGAELLDFIGKGTARVRLEVLTRESRQMAEAAKRGMDTSRLTMADLQRFDADKMAATQPASAPAPVSPASREAAPVRVASRDYDSDALPESLQTPTITVEELSAPPSSMRDYQPSRPVTGEAPPRQQPMGMLGTEEQYATPSGMAPGRMAEGRFMPAPVVTQEPVSRTGIFVQAGAFGVRANADRLKANLAGVAPVRIDPITVRGKTLYRVKLGPLSSVSQADSVLERVISLGGDGARVVHD